MKIEYKFRDMDFSTSLSELCEEKIAKMKRFIFEPVQVHLTFFQEGHNRHIDIYIHGHQCDFRASARGHSFPAVIDQAFGRITRQMQRKKKKVQMHKQPAFQERLELLRDQMPEVKKAG